MRIVFLLRQSPYGSTLAREALDMALAAAAFDQTVQLVFMSDGVYQLINAQQSQLIQRKNIEKTLDALSLYDINTLFVDSQSLSQRGLTMAQLRSDVSEIDKLSLQQLIAEADQVINL